MRVRTDRPQWDRIALAGVVAALVLRLIHLAISLDPALPPDETTHAGQALHHTAFWGLPHDTPESAELGLVSHRPFLYSWLLARWLLLDPGITSELVWLRLANVAMAVGTLMAALAWARRAGASPGARLLLAVVLTNLPMWSFLSATVNYDNAAMLLATSAFALLARYVDAVRGSHEPDEPDEPRGPPPATLVGLVLVLVAGVLTKAAMLPFAALMVLALIAATGGRAGRDGLALLRSPLAAGPALASLLAATLLLGALAIGLYGGNLIRFGVLEPAANQVVALEEANRNRIFRQEHVLRSYRAGAIDFRQATSELATIEHPGDRAGAMWMLRRARELRRGEGEPLVGRIRYVTLWTPLMAERLFGVMGHRELYKSGMLAAAYGLVALAALATLAWRLRSSSVHVRIAAGVAAGYALILMQAVNYPIYRTTGLSVEAVQGRYLFPILAPLLGASIIAVAGALPPRARWAVGIAVAALFVLGDFPYLLLRAEPAWWGQP